MTTYRFDDRKAMSDGVAENQAVEQILLEHVPGAMGVSRAGERADRNGTDYWIDHHRGDPMSVDLKARDIDPIVEFGADDVALETWSVVGVKIGWTLDTTKRTDYVLWLWKPTRRWALVPFALLCASFGRRREARLRTYKVRRQTTPHGAREWTSECVFVPRREIWAAIYTDFAGGARNVPPATALGGF